MIRQTKITVSGCQIWKKQILAVASNRFAFASTLAVYIYDLKNYQLQKLLTGSDSNISAIAWDPKDENNLAQASVDKKFCIWDLETEKIKFEVQLTSHVLHIEWNRHNVNQLYLVQSNGEIKQIDLTNKLVNHVDIKTKAKPQSLKSHPSRPQIMAISLDNGSIVFLDTSDMTTYTLDAADVKGRQKEKVDEIINSQQTINEEIALAIGILPNTIKKKLKVEDDEVVIEELQWDPFEGNLLVSFGDGSLNMISFQGLSNSSKVMQTFERQSNVVTNILWSNDKSGNFLTASSKQGALQFWNVASREPKNMFKVGNYGVHNICMVSNNPLEQRVLIALVSGAVCIFNLQKRSIDFQSEAGHNETIFETEFCPQNKNLLASCSYDGTVRVWDVSQMKLIAVNDTSRGSVQAKIEKKIIYSISWHPTDTKIALVTVNGNLIIYDALKAKLLSSITPIEQHGAFKVAWNQLQPQFILMSSGSGTVFLVEVLDPLTCKSLQVKQQYKHIDSVFGVAWNPKQQNMFITGCKDAKVRMFDVMSPNPVKVFTGHQDRVYNVIFNPNLPNLIASGSDDLTIRIWDTTREIPAAITVCGGHDVKGSHTGNVRALAFLPEITWCLISGSWDSLIKLWDIRNGNCMYTITDHNSDVYGITLHPARPFLFASCSRDTTIRLFSIDGLVSSLKMQLLHDSKIDNNKNQVFDTPQATYDQKGTYKLCTPNSSELIHRTFIQDFKSELTGLTTMYDFVQFSEGQPELLNCIEVLSSDQQTVHAQDLEVIHMYDLPAATLRQAELLRSATGMQMLNTQFAKKEDRLKEAARLFMTLGRIKDFCEIQFELKNYKKAMAFAPGVSIEFWQELAERHASILEQEGKEQAAIACIVADKLQNAVQLFQMREEFEDGKLVNALQLTGVFTNVLTKIKSKEVPRQLTINEVTKNLKSTNFGDDPQLAKYVASESDRYFYQGKTFLAAATHLSINDFKSAIQVLVRSNELYLAFYLARYFYTPALKEVAILLALRAERFFHIDICLKILKDFANDSDYEELVRRRLCNLGLLPKSTSKDEDEAIAKQGKNKFDSGQVVEGLRMLVLGNDLENACQCAADYISSTLRTPSVEGFVGYIKVIELLQTANISKVQPTTKQRVLVYSVYLGVYKAIWYGFFEILNVMCNYLVKIGSETDPTFKQFTDTIIDSIKSYKDESDPVPSFFKVPMTFATKAMQERYDTFLAAFGVHMKTQTHLFSTPGIYLYMINGTCLQGRQLSALTNTLIRGQVYQLEDGKTCISQEESIEWAICNKFTSLCNGSRINPF